MDAPRLPGYDAVRKLGSGTCADVYLYRRRRPECRAPDGLHAYGMRSAPSTGSTAAVLEAEVAVKVSRGRLDGLAAGRWRTEAGALRRLSAHPAVLRLIDAGVTDDGAGYLVLEYAPHGSYRNRMRAGGVSPEHMLDLGVRLAGALADAHRLGIVHRDVKPANVLIGARGQPLLADFGIAANVYQARRATGLSVPWAAPEVIAGRNGGDEASDIYSLGATLFGVLTGSAPRRDHDARMGGDPSEPACRDHLPPTHRPSIPAEVEAVLRRALAIDPDDRYDDAVAFARAMQWAQYHHDGRVTPLTAHAVAPYPPRMTGMTEPANSTDLAQPIGSAESSVAVQPDASTGKPQSATPTEPATPAKPIPTAGHAPAAHWRRLRGVRGVVGAATAGMALTGVAALITSAGLPPFVSTTDGLSVAATMPGAADAPRPPAPRSDPVPAVEQLHGVYHGDEVTFTWRNPDPRHGDAYAWVPVDAVNAEGLLVTSAFGPDAQLTDATTLTLDGTGTDHFCIGVKTVRFDRRTAVDTPYSCAFRR